MHPSEVDLGRSGARGVIDYKHLSSDRFRPCALSGQCALSAGDRSTQRRGRDANLRRDLRDRQLAARHERLHDVIFRRSRECGFT